MKLNFLISLATVFAALPSWAQEIKHSPEFEPLRACFSTFPKFEHPHSRGNGTLITKIERDSGGDLLVNSIVNVKQVGSRFDISVVRDNQKGQFRSQTFVIEEKDVEQGLVTLPISADFAAYCYSRSTKSFDSACELPLAINIDRVGKIGMDHFRITPADPREHRFIRMVQEKQKSKVQTRTLATEGALELMLEDAAAQIDDLPAQMAAERKPGLEKILTACESAATRLAELPRMSLNRERAITKLRDSIATARNPSGKRGEPSSNRPTPFEASKDNPLYPKDFGNPAGGGNPYDRSGERTPKAQ